MPLHPLSCALISAFGLLALPAAAQSVETEEIPVTEMAVYVGGHQDDWQLFRGNAAAADLLAPDTRTVFIYATGGDAGRTDGWWEAREQGTIEAVRAVVGATPVTLDVVQMNDHPIVRYTVGNSVSYVLRLPDGRYQHGDGYPATGNESLSQLRDIGKPVSAIDGSTTYTSWADFWGTLEAILEHERSQVPGATHPWVHAPDYAGEDNASPTCDAEASCNPCDHPDHKAVGDALREFVSGTYNRSWWVGYDSSTRPANLSGDGFRQKGRAFFGYANAVERATRLNGAPQSPSLDEWRLWGERDYVRTVPWNQPDVDDPVCEAE